MYQSGNSASVDDIQLDAATPSEGDAGVGPSIVFPDKDLLFTAEFKRSGGDLLLLGHDGRKAVVHDYFKADRRASLISLEGAELSAATIEALAGPAHPGEYAQAMAADVSQKLIGRVEKVSGSATVIRNGVAVALHLGDPVAKGDVVQTGSDSSLTIKFNDGTVFGLSASARIILNEMIYAGDSGANSALFTLVQGAIGFIAGRIARTGDLKMETPVATMAIRGTAVETEISAVSGTTKFSLLTEPDGRAGSFLLFDRHNPSRVLASISDPRIATVISPAGTSEVSIAQLPKSESDIRLENALVRDLFTTFSLEPRQRRGSSDPEGIPELPVLHALAPVEQHSQPLETARAPLPPAVLEARATLADEVVPAIRGAAVEDGPPVRLRSVGLTPADHGSTVVTASLPPGVSYNESTRTFALDPSHPAYQRLGAGEKAVVTVTYDLVSAGDWTSSSVSWTVTGRNDAPSARPDHFARAEEAGHMILAVRDNDTDIDRDAFHVSHWTEPIEGSVSLGRAGNLIFNPGQDFRTLSAGETATVSFAYTISDGKGGTDTTDVTVQVRGAGTFSSPTATAEASGMLAFNHEPVSLIIAAPLQTTRATADLNMTISLGPVPQPMMNILYAVDISASVSEPFTGSPVGDFNQDGIPNTILDAEIESLIGLTERIRSLGFSPADVNVTVIPFNGSANPAEETEPAQNASNTASVTFNLGNSTTETMASFLTSLKAGGRTSFEDALRAAIEKLQTLDHGDDRNVVYMLSDGNGTGSFADERAILETTYQARIAAFGVGEDANLASLDRIDNTGGAERITSTDQIDTSPVGFPVPRGQIVDLDVFVNGREVPDAGPDDLVVTPGGSALNLPLTGLARHVGETNEVTASVTFADGEVLTAQTRIGGALPLSADFIL